ncbi:hypothetical protein ACFQ1I_17525 [Kitasatospora arboriphila]
MKPPTLTAVFGCASYRRTVSMSEVGTSGMLRLTSPSVSPAVAM